MKCLVCGNDGGFWGKLTTHSNERVCKECREKAKNQMQVVLRSVSAEQSFKLQYAQGWVVRFDETAKKYELAESETAPLKFSLLNEMFMLVERGDVMTEADLKYLADLTRKYAVGQTAPPELLDTIFRIGVREVIQSWEQGDVPQKECGGLLLQKGEVCHWEEGAALRIQRTKREYVGAFASVSVPVPLTRRSRFRVGGFKGHPIDSKILENGGAGLLHVTNQRICFTGPQNSVAIPYKKIISVGGFDGGFIVQTANEKKPGIFIVRHPELTTQLVSLASHPPEEESAPSGRQKKLPSTS
jgi:hypothetical protein